MSKADHMLSILWLLRDGRRMTAQQLADMLEIHVRTVYRYIDALCASGVPVVAHAGPGGGYALLERFADAPLVFGMEEQKALLHASMFALEAGYPHGEALRSAVAKLKLYSTREQADELNRHLSGFDVIQPAADPALDAVLQLIERAVAAGRSLEIEYQSGYGGLATARCVDPYGLLYWKASWYMIGYCRLRGGIRSFRADRILRLEETDLTFERPADFSARQYFLSRLLPEPADPREALISVRIHGNPRAIDDLCKHWLLGHAIAERTDSEAHLKLDERAIRFYVPYFLLPYGKSIRILEPHSLKERMAEVARELADHYRLAENDGPARKH